MFACSQLLLWGPGAPCATAMSLAGLSHRSAARRLTYCCPRSMQQVMARVAHFNTEDRMKKEGRDLLCFLFGDMQYHGTGPARLPTLLL